MFSHVLSVLVYLLVVTSSRSHAPGRVHAACVAAGVHDISGHPPKMTRASHPVSHRRCLQVARIAEWLTEKVDALSTKTRIDPKDEEVRAI